MAEPFIQSIPGRNEALLNIRDVIHLTKSKRFLDEAMSSLMEAIRASRPDAALPDAELAKLHSRTIEKCKAELLTPLFAGGHVVSIYWESISRSIVERSFRDAIKLNVPLYCLQAADKRVALKSKKHEEQVTHTLLTTPNIHKTGQLCGMLVVHVGMCLRLSDVLSPRSGLVKDKLGKAVAVQLHDHDQRRLDMLPAGYCLFSPEYMAQGIGMQMLKYPPHGLLISAWKPPRTRTQRRKKSPWQTL